MIDKLEVSKYERFTKQLLKWNKEKNQRSMPWKGEKDPYKIWLSEIILQQTRVEQGLNYYNRFVTTFPTVNKLAKAPDEKVFKLWEGLGYYSRCKNLIETAKKIANEYKGSFPNDYENILALKGVGPYTAAAIASFAFNQPYAVLDGNVFRVLARYFGKNTAIDTESGKREFSALSQKLLDRKQPGRYNQAIMDFGAVVCKPQQPLCETCYLKNDCSAYAENKVEILPVKEKKITIRQRWFYYVVVVCKTHVLMRKRSSKDIWEGLYEFLLYESGKPLQKNEIRNIDLLKEFVLQGKAQVNLISEPIIQKLSHQTIQAQFIEISTLKQMPQPGYEWIPVKQLKKMPFPKIITTYLKDKNLSLNLI